MYIYEGLYRQMKTEFSKVYPGLTFAEDRERFDSGYWDSRNSYVMIRDSSKTNVFCFGISQFPTCCGLMEAWGFSTSYGFKNENFLKAIQFLPFVAFRAGYTECFVTLENYNQKGFIEAFKEIGAKPIYDFVNGRTRHSISVLSMQPRELKPV